MGWDGSILLEYLGWSVRFIRHCDKGHASRYLNTMIPHLHIFMYERMRDKSRTSAPLSMSTLLPFV